MSNTIPHQPERTATAEELAEERARAGRARAAAPKRPRYPAAAELERRHDQVLDIGQAVAELTAYVHEAVELALLRVGELERSDKAHAAAITILARRLP
jgi:hypothetical protein